MRSCVRLCHFQNLSLLANHPVPIAAFPVAEFLAGRKRRTTLQCQVNRIIGSEGKLAMTFPSGISPGYLFGRSFARCDGRRSLRYCFVRVRQEGKIRI